MINLKKTKQQIADVYREENVMPCYVNEVIQVKQSQVFNFYNELEKLCQKYQPLGNQSE